MGPPEDLRLIMKIVLDVPDDVAARLATAWGDVSRGALMAIAAAGYRDGTLSRQHLGRTLGFSFWETETFLKARVAYLAYDEQDLDHDRRDLADLRRE
jgi:hypothetical protein